jgi:hypothetical protein
VREATAFGSARARDLSFAVNRNRRREETAETAQQTNWKLRSVWKEVSHLLEECQQNVREFGLHYKCIICRYSFYSSSPIEPRKSR